MAPQYSEPLFVISVAARLVQMHPQTLRKYEREGLVAPSRTSGNLRLYSDQDIERLRQVKYLVEERGLNLAGVQLALELTQRLRELRAGVTEVGEAAAKGVCVGTEFATALARELDDVLGMLGHVDEAEVRARRAVEGRKVGSR